MCFNHSRTTIPALFQHILIEWHSQDLTYLFEENGKCVCSPDASWGKFESSYQDSTCAVELQGRLQGKEIQGGRSNHRSTICRTDSIERGTVLPKITRQQKYKSTKISSSNKVSTGFNKTNILHTGRRYCLDDTLEGYDKKECDITHHLTKSGLCRHS